MKKTEQLVRLNEVLLFHDVRQNGKRETGIARTESGEERHVRGKNGKESADRNSENNFECYRNN